MRGMLKMTTIGHFALRAASIAAASRGRRSSVSVPLPPGQVARDRVHRHFHPRVFARRPKAQECHSRARAGGAAHVGEGRHRVAEEHHAEGRRQQIDPSSSAVAASASRQATLATPAASAFDA
jgi:hypothetical protein